jgi:integrase
LRLTQADVDLGCAMLTIRLTKFRKSRFVPIHPTTVAALRAYAKARDRLVSKSSCNRFFVSGDGRPLAYFTVRTVFRNLCDACRITGVGPRRPRLHDLRHTFACRRVELWYEARVDLEHAVSSLSVYLGHAKVSDTYWYLTATPALLARAAERFEHLVRPSAEEVQP